MKNFLYRLFFTRDDDMDLLQLFFLIIIIFFMLAFALAAMGKWTVSNAAWTAFISVFGTLAISGTPKWIAVLLSKRDSGNSSYINTDEPPIEQEESEIG